MTLPRIVASRDRRRSAARGLLLVICLVAALLPAVTAAAAVVGRDGLPPGDAVRSAAIRPHSSEPPAAPDPTAEPAIAEGQAGGLLAVACASPTSCEAVGFQGAYGGLSQSSLGQVVSIDNGSFGKVHDLTDAGTMLSVACPTATDCYAVGVDLVTDPTTQVVEEVPAFLPIVNGSPGSPTNVLVPDDGEPVLYDGQLAGISCQTATKCVAVGYTYAGDKSFVIPVVDGALGDVTYLPAGQLNAVSCDPTQCLAVGGYDNDEGFYVNVAGGKAGSEESVAGTQDFTGVTCAKGDCVAVGYSDGGPPAAVDVDNGVAGTPEFGSSGVDQQAFMSVACAPEANGLGTCMTGGEGSNGSVNDGDLTPLGTDTQLLTKPSTQIAPGDWVLPGLTCPEAGACIGVGWSTAGAAEMSPICTYETQTSGNAPDLVTRTAGGTRCNLFVSVNAVDGLPKVGGLRTGLDYVKPHAAFTGDATPDGRGGSISNSCYSGCIDLKVTVQVLSDRGTIIAVPGAEVEADITPSVPAKDIPSLPRGSVKPGNGLLCELDAIRSTVGAPTVEGFDATSHCSSKLLSDVTTDKYGTAFIRLWAPGLIANASTKVNVKVTTGCQGTGCLPFSQAEGTSSESLGVYARSEYDDTTTLSPNVVDQLIALAKNTAPAKFAKTLGKAAATAIVLVLLGEEAAALGPHVVKDVLTDFASDYGTETWEYIELEALFMGTVFKVPDVGLGASKTTLVGLLNSSFRNTLVGMLKKFGLQLEGLEQAGGTVPAQSVTLKVYEVSYCDPSHTTDCGPGVNDDTTGVRSYLYFWFHSQTSSTSNTFTDDFVTAYNPNLWLEAKFGK